MVMSNATPRQVGGHTACTDLAPAYPPPPRGGRGFEARYQAWRAACVAIDARRELSCRSDAGQFWGLSSCNDCADHVTGIPWHMRRPGEPACPEPCAGELALALASGGRS